MKCPTIIATLSILLFASACNVNVQDGHGTTGPNGIPLDSGTTIVTHTEEHSTSHSGFEIKGSMDSKSHTSIHTTTKVEKTKTLAQQVDAWQAAIFMNYETVDLDPKDEKPSRLSRDPLAQETVSRSLQRKQPITNAYGKSVHPRVLLKAYRFASPAALTTQVESWLNSLGSATKGIELGQNVASTKSLPMVCAVVGADFVFVEANCANEGNEWFFTKEVFFATLAEQGAGYTWEIQCGDGELVYVLGGE